MGDTIFSAKTLHSGVRIEHSAGELQLKFDSDDAAIQSAINIHHPHRLAMENLRYLMGILQFINEPKKILLLGVGGGSLVHFLTHYLPNSDITGVEYDGALLDIAQEQLNLPAQSQRLHYVIADAREYLQQSTDTFDLVVVDIFSGGLSPSWLLTSSSIGQLKSCLTERGGIAYNLLFRDKKTATGFYAAFRRVFHQQTLLLETQDYENLLVYGLNFNAPRKDLTQWLQQCPELSDRYQLPFTRILSAIYDINPVGSGII